MFRSVSSSALNRVAVSGGAAVTICPAGASYGIHWSRDGIVFGQGSEGILRVSENGGKPEHAVSVKGDELADSPQMLPDGQAVMFTLAAGTGADRWDKARIVVQSLKTGERKTLIEGGSDGRYLPTGHVVYAVGGVLYAAPFDLQRLSVTSGPVFPIVEGVRRGGATGAAQFSVSNTGSLMFVPGPAATSSALRELGLIDRTGVLQLLKIPPGPYENPRVSPDGKQVTFGTDDGKEAIVWIYDLAGTSSIRRLTFGGRNRFPIWSSDSQRAAFQSDREGDQGIFWQRADGTGPVERLTKADQGASHVPQAWSPDGERFVFQVTSGANNTLWTFSIRDKKGTRFSDVESANPISASFSPDGRWVAYDSRERGRGQRAISVQPFPPTGAKYQLSAQRDDYRRPLWSPDGKELLFATGGGTGSVVAVLTKPTFRFGFPQPLLLADAGTLAPISRDSGTSCRTANESLASSRPGRLRPPPGRRRRFGWCSTGSRSSSSALHAEEIAGHRGSSRRLPSDFRLQTSDFKLQTSDFQRLTLKAHT